MLGHHKNVDDLSDKIQSEVKKQLENDKDTNTNLIEEMKVLKTRCETQDREINEVTGKLEKIKKDFDTKVKVIDVKIKDIQKLKDREIKKLKEQNENKMKELETKLRIFDDITKEIEKMKEILKEICYKENRSRNKSWKFGKQ